MKRTTKHGREYFKQEVSPIRRRIWKAQRRKAQRANDKRAVKEVF